MYEIGIKEFSQLTTAELKEIGSYRYSVFVERLQWRLPLSIYGDGYELDEYDKPGAVYVIAKSVFGGICGFMRMQPTTRNNLLADHFAHLCDEAPPTSVHDWELTRFTSHNPWGLDLSIQIFYASIEYVRAQGADNVVGIVNHLHGAILSAKDCGIHTARCTSATRRREVERYFDSAQAVQSLEHCACSG